MYGAVVLILLALIFAGCTRSLPRNPVSQAALLLVEAYHTWTCQDLADEASLLTDALEAATAQQPNAETKGRVAHIQRSSEAVHNEMARKKCK